MKHIAVIKNKPVFSGKRSTPDGAINGNGDLAVILGNSPSGMRIYISKCDLWYASETFKKGGIKPLGYIDIDIEEELYNNYRVEQDMDKGELRCEFKAGNRDLSFSVFVSKTENSIVIKSAECRICFLIAVRAGSNIALLRLRLLTNLFFKATWAG